MYREGVYNLLLVESCLYLPPATMTSPLESTEHAQLNRVEGRVSHFNPPPGVRLVEVDR